MDEQAPSAAPGGQPAAPQKSGKGKTGWIIAIMIIILAAAGAYAYSKQNKDAGNPAETAADDAMQAMPSIAQGQNTETVEGTPTIEEGNVKTFTLTTANFSFAPNKITVNKGDTVKIVLKNSEGFHDWVLDEFNAKTPRISGDQTAEVQFVADKTGTFEFYCSVGNHRQMGMVGTLVVQ